MSEKGIFSRLKDGLTKTRDNFVAGIDNIFNGFSEIDDDFYEELEEVLIMADIGVNTTSKIIENLQQKSQRAEDQRDQCLQATVDRQYQRSDARG